MTTPMVDAQNVYKSYGALDVLRGVTLSVQPGEVMCMIGPSGGQVDLPALHQPPRADQCRAPVRRRRTDGLRGSSDGSLYEMALTKGAKQRREIGMVFQRFNLFPHVTALGNITMAVVQS
jgi:polar amino acid transport system ATP-binding protein